MISIALEWFRTPKPISGIGWIGLDWDGIRVFGGIEHLTVLIIHQALKKIQIEPYGRVLGESCALHFDENMRNHIKLISTNADIFF